MGKRVWLIILLVVLLSVIGVAAVQAQEVRGAIRGTLYQDTNADGVCGAGDPAISGVPIEFAPDGGQTITLTSGANGTYGLASASLGTWRVTAKPLEGWVTTSQVTIVVVLSAEQNTAENVNFCLAQVTVTQPIAPTPTPVPPPTTLPESGASVAPTVLVAAALGVVLLIAGMGLIIRERRAGG